MKRIYQFCAITFALAAIVGPLPSQAQSFPDRPVKLVMPYPPGGGPDNVARILGERLTRMWGQPVLIENKTGGNGWIAMDAAKRAQPDGYTLLILDAALPCLQPHIHKSYPFNPFKDFEPVAPMFSAYFFAVTKSDSNWKNIGDLIAAAKQKDGRITYGTSGIGSLYHMGGAMLESASGTRMMSVPYKETMQIFTDITSGQVDWSFATASTASAMIHAKKLKYLAIAAPKRHPNYPDVPTMAESGGPNLVLRTWVGIFAPSGIPKDIVNRISNDVSKVMAEPAVKEKLAAVGLDAWSAPAFELKKALQDDYKVFGDIAKKVKIEVD